MARLKMSTIEVDKLIKGTHRWNFQTTRQQPQDPDPLSPAISARGIEEIIKQGHIL